MAAVAARGGGGGGGGGGSTGNGNGSLVFSPYKDTSINMNWNTNVITDQRLRRADRARRPT